VIAPENFMPLEWIVDYEEANHRKLFQQGRADAERVLKKMSGTIADR
jgi:NTE family protein